MTNNQQLLTQGDWVSGNIKTFAVGGGEWSLEAEVYSNNEYIGTIEYVGSNGTHCKSDPLNEWMEEDIKNYLNK